MPGPASKAAVNMITVQYAKAFPGMRINAGEPGYTATDLNGSMGTQTVEGGAEIIVRMAQVGPDGPTGSYVGAEGPLPWQELCRHRAPGPWPAISPAARPLRRYWPVAVGRGRDYTRGTHEQATADRKVPASPTAPCPA